MNILLTSALLLLVATAPGESTRTIESMVRDYYGTRLEGKAISWTIEMRRLPELRPGEEMVKVYGEESSETPRGSRICWLQVQNGSKKRDLPVTLVVKPVEIVPVTRVNIDPRTEIGPEMIEWEETETQSFGATHIATKEDLEGTWSKVRIPAGTVITSRRIAPKPAVVLGQQIKIVLRIGQIEATAEGKALEDGRIGEKIRVQNLVNGSRLRGILEKGGMVLVE